MCDCCSGDNELKKEEECCGDENCDCTGENCDCEEENCSDDGCGCGCGHDHGHAEFDNDDYETWGFVIEKDFAEEIRKEAENNNMEFEEFVYQAIEMAVGISQGQYTLIDPETGVLISGNQVDKDLEDVED